MSLNIEQQPQLKRDLLSSRKFTATTDPAIVLDERGQPNIDVRVVKIVDRGRKDFGDIIGLSESLRQNGVIAPIKLSKTITGWLLVAGERRIRAFLLTGHRYIPFTYGDDDPVWAAEAELEENVRRKDISWPEQCFMLEKLHNAKIKQFGQHTAGDTRSTGGWTMQKTAAVAEEDAKSVGQKLAMAGKLRNDPTLLERIAHLPLSAALKEVTKIEQRKAYADKVTAGTAIISANVILTDALKGLDAIKNSSIDLWLTDPPFGNSEITQQTGSNRDSMTYTGIIKPTDNMNSASFRNLFSAVLQKMSQKLKPGAHTYIFFAFEHFEWLRIALTELGWLVEPAPLIWDKERAVTPFLGYNYPSSYEPILFAKFQTNTKRLNGDNLRNVFRIPPVQQKSRSHPFQKPQKLLVDLISRSTEKGEMVLDTFAGSGAVIKAAKLLERNALGFEIDPENWASSQMFLQQP